MDIATDAPPPPLDQKCFQTGRRPTVQIAQYKQCALQTQKIYHRMHISRTALHANAVRMLHAKVQVAQPGERAISAYAPATCYAGSNVGVCTKQNKNKKSRYEKSFSFCCTVIDALPPSTTRGKTRGVSRRRQAWKPRLREASHEPVAPPKVENLRVMSLHLRGDGSATSQSTVDILGILEVGDRYSIETSDFDIQD